MDEQRQRLLDDLLGEFEGDLHVDAVTREVYSSDGSIYQILPLGVACPRHTADVALLANYSHENDIPLIARGAGSGVAGGCLGRGLIVDFSRYMNEILEINESTVRVQPGVVRDQLNRHLRKSGRYFPPDPSNSLITTVGGMLAVDAAGSHAIRVGSTRDHVIQIETVLAGGHVINAREYSDVLSIPEPGFENELVHRTGQLLREHEPLIRLLQPPLIRNCSGFHLRSVLNGDQLNLPRLLVGSEGALGVFTEATLHISELPSRQGVALLLFKDLESSIEAIQAIVTQQPSACDLLDRRLLSLARDADTRFEQLIPTFAEAAVLVEQTGYSDEQVKDRLQNTIQAARRANPSLFIAQEAYGEDEAELLWSLPQRVVPLLIKLRGETRPIPIVEDIAVPPDSLNEFLKKAQRVFQKHWVTATLYAHAASGQIHFRPFMQIPNTTNAEKVETLSRDLYDAAFEFGGTVSGEHGNGLARTAFVQSQYGPLYKVFQQVKELFDPHNLMNPGKIINDDSHLTIRNFRVNPDLEGERPELVPLQLRWDGTELEEEVLKCNGCGSCRVDDALFRMCPLFKRSPSEINAPRSKANLLRAVITNSVDQKIFSTDEAKLLAESCFNCKQCHLECPSNVNIPALAIEVKAQTVAASGLGRADWYLSRAHSFGRFGVSISPFANWALNNPMMRWLIERLFGISQARRLPKFARREFLKTSQAKSRSDEKLFGKPAQAVYFVDHYANFHDIELSDAFMRILDHHEIPTVVPQEQVASGMAMISAGDLDGARDLAEKNVTVLAEYAREGKSIVCSEPTAAVCLKYEYPRLTDHPDVRVVANRTVDAGTFLQHYHTRGELKTDFAPLELKIAYHTPCHQRFLNPNRPLVELLKLIPKLQVVEIEKGCSGMAGAFGMTAINFEKSLEIGAELIEEMKRPDLDLGATECSSCQFQMLQESLIPTLHPLKLLAYSYGLMPSIGKKLSPYRNKRILIT